MKKYLNLMVLLVFLSFIPTVVSADSFTRVNAINNSTIGDQKILVLLLKYTNSGPDPLTTKEMYQRIFQGPFQQFYKEQSYGKISFSGDVYGWYTIPTVIPDSVYNIFDTNDVISTVIKDNNINIGQYSRLVIVVNAPFMLDLSTLGKNSQVINGVSYNISKSLVAVTINNINSPNSLPGQAISWSYFDYTLSHEIGHALGIPHAQGLNCGDKIFSTKNCITMEYGNPFDIMGGQSISLHMSAYYKELLGWIDPRSEIVINKPGEYTLNSLETPFGSKVARIQIANGKTPFYLEYRTPVGFDSSLKNPQVINLVNGLIINYVSFDNIMWSMKTSKLLNLSPSSSPSCIINASSSPTSSTSLICWNSSVLHNSSLKGSNSFPVPGSNLVIGPIIATTTNAITFRVSRSNTQIRKSSLTANTKVSPPQHILGWTTYTNDKYKFSFQYPATYTIAKPDSRLMTFNNISNILQLNGVPDNILISYANVTTLDFPNARYGSYGIYFNEKTNQWKRNNSNNNIAGITESDITPSYTSGGLAYFDVSTGISSEIAVALSHHEFVLISAADNGPIRDVIDKIATTLQAFSTAN